MRGRLTASPASKSRNATRIASMHSRIGSNRRTSSSVMMMVIGAVSRVSGASGRGGLGGARQRAARLQASSAAQFVANWRHIPKDIREESMAWVKVTDIAYARLRSPDLDVMEEFLTRFGMHRSERTANALYMRGTFPFNDTPTTEKGDPKFVGIAYYAESEDDLK